MRKLFLILILCLFISAPVWALNGEDTQQPTDNSTTDESTNYRIDLGSGDGALLIIGDGNQVYLPPEAEEVEDKIQPNEITYSENRGSFMCVLTETDIYVDGVRTRYSKVVLELTADGWDLVWFEQE
jgi:hypothetical protein